MTKTGKPVNCAEIENTMEFLFVYGTLLEPENPVGQLLRSNAEYYADGYFQGKLYDLGDYPGALESKNPKDKVFGSVFIVRKPETVFPVLDDYEEVGDQFPAPNEYTRKMIQVFTTNTELIYCHVYLFNRSVDCFRQIESGIFTRDND